MWNSANGVCAINGSPTPAPTPLALGLNVGMSHLSPRDTLQFNGNGNPIVSGFH